MNYIKEAENVLEHYTDLEYSMKNIEKRIIKLKYSGAPKELKASVLDDICIKVTPKHDETINILCELKILVDERCDVIKQLDEIDKFLQELSEDEGCELYGKVLRMWYIDKFSKEKIAGELFYECKQSVYNIRNKAIRKFTVRWFGITGLKAI